MAAANSQINNASLNSSSSSANDKSKVTIVGDVTNNALVITANPTVMIQLRNVINKLDVAPKQVLVESVIAEVDAQTAKQLGIEWGTATPSASASATGLDSAGAISSYSYGGGGMGVGFVQSGDMRALIAMIASDANSNIVSTPSVTVLNNAPADIEVGENVSQVSAEYTGGQTSSDTFAPPTTYQDKQIGLTLKVIPQITGDHSVRLVIDQENSAIVDDATLKGQSPNAPTSEEKISTQVMVNNGQVLVLGGLINSQDRTVLNKVPILGDIPIIGRLFQSHSTTKVKKDLMIFLRPVIIQNEAQAKALTQNRYDFMRDVAILNNNKQGVLIASSTLPEREPSQLPSPFTASQ
jgi:general secretion pathway protein D